MLLKFWTGGGGDGGNYTPQKHPILSSPYIHLPFKTKLVQNHEKQGRYD